MIEFKINSKTYEITDPTIRDYYAFQTLLVQDTAQAKLKIVSVLSKCAVEELKKLSTVQFANLWTEVVNGPLNNQINNTFYKHFALNGKLYGFSDFKELTIGEFADMDVLRQDPRKDQMLHKMMAVLYRPATDITDDWIVVEPYEPNSVDSRAELFLDMPLKYVFGALSFFLSIRNASIEVMLDSLKKTRATTMEELELVQLTSQLIYDLPAIGTGLSASWLETTQQRLMQLQNLASTMHSTSSPIEKTKPKKKKWSWNVLKLKIN